MYYKMSIYWIRVGPISNMTAVLIIREMWTQRQMNRENTM